MNPPSGHGVYARGQSVEYLRQFDFVALNSLRADTVAKARQLKDAGKRVYLYSTPGEWTPIMFPAGRARILAKCAQLRGVVSGYIADPENDWAQFSSGEQRNALARGFGRLLAQDADVGAPEHGLGPLDVGITSFPNFPALDGFASGCEGKVWASPQLYVDRGEAVLLAFMERWRQAFSHRLVIPSVACWKNANAPGIHTPAGYAQYLDTIPEAVGAIAWTVTRDTAWMTAAYLDYNPAGNPITGAFLRASGFFTSPAGIAIAVIALIVLVAAAVWIV